MAEWNALLAQFSETWNLFIRWKLPSFLEDAEDNRFGVLNGRPALARLMLPAVGAVAGCCLYLPVWGITAVFGRIVGGIAAAVLVPLVIEFATGWSGLTALASYIRLRRQGVSHEEAFFAKPESMEEPRPPASMVMMLILYFLRMVMFGVLAAFYCPFWYIIVLTGGCLVRSHLCGMNEPGHFGEHYYPLPDEKMQKYAWYLGLGIMILAGFFHIPAALLAFVMAGGIAWVAKQLCLDSISGINRQAVDVFGYTTEIILLFVGVLLFTGPSL